MLVLLSCAKTMSAVSKVKVPLTTSPRFQKEAAEIALQMSQFSVDELERLLRVNAKTKKPVTVENGLYQTWQKPVYEGKELRFIPYYAWANRGEGEMEVWVNQL